MAGFNLKQNLNEAEFRRVRTSGSQAYTIGDAVMADPTSDSTDVVPATSSTTHQNILGIAVETIAATATSLLIAIIEPSQVWECETANAVNANHNYQNMVLTDANTVNNTGTDSVADQAVVQQVGVLGSKGLFRFRGDST